MRLKWIAAALAALIIVVVVVLVIVISSYDFNKLKPQISEAAYQATGRRLDLIGDISLKLGFTPVLKVSKVSFENAPWGSRPSLAEIKSFELEVALLPLIGGNVFVKRLVLVEPDILVEVNARGKSNLEFEPPQPADEGDKAGKEPKEEGLALGSLAFDKVVIVDGTFGYSNSSSGALYEVGIKKLTAKAPGFDKPVRLALEGSYNRSDFALSGELGSIRALAEAKQKWPLDVNASVVGLEVMAKGSITDPMNLTGLDLEFAGKTKNVKALGKLIGSSVPIDGPLELSGKLNDPESGTYKVSGLSLEYFGSDLSGEVELSTTGKRPRVSAELDSRLLDLRPILAGKEKESKDQPAGGHKKAADVNQGEGKRLIPDVPLPLETLKSVDASLRIKVKELIHPRARLGDVTLMLTLADGNLAVKRLKTRAAGGSVSGTARLGSSGSLKANLKAEKLDIGVLLEDAGIGRVVSAQADFSTNLSSKGASVASMLASLSGSTELTVGSGVIDNDYINKLKKGNAVNLLRLINPATDAGDFTTLNCLVNSLVIKDGLASTKFLVFDTALMSVSGKGYVDLKDESIEVSLRPVPKERLGAGKYAMAFGELARPLRLGGTLAHPKLELDTEEAIKTIGKALIGGAVHGYDAEGIASSLAAGAKEGAENPCVAAMESSPARDSKEREPVESDESQPVEEIQKTIEKGIDEGLKKLFGR